METVSNTVSSIANVASKAIWGDSTTETTKDETTDAEPLSGETGDVKAGEPYDKGNLDSTDTETTKPATESESTSAPSTDNTTMPGSTSTTMPLRSEHETSKTGVTSAHDPPSSLAPSDKPISSNDTSGAGPTTSDGAPSLTARPVEEQEKGQQGAEKPLADPNSDRTKKEGVVGGISHVGGGESLQKESVGEGTGEKYIKSSGEKADGGDFNAANAGAGKEADRLLEQKGIHHDSPAEAKTDTPTKVSLKDKLKAKLHRHKDSKE